MLKIENLNSFKIFPIQNQLLIPFFEIFVTHKKKCALHSKLLAGSEFCIIYKRVWQCKFQSKISTTNTGPVSGPLDVRHRTHLIQIKCKKGIFLHGILFISIFEHWNFLNISASYFYSFLSSSLPFLSIILFSFLPPKEGALNICWVGGYAVPPTRVYFLAFGT